MNKVTRSEKCMHIGIDARFYGSLGKGLGRYTEKLIEHLENIDKENDYVIFLRRENFSEYTPKNSRFKKEIAQYAWYGLAEQTLFVIRLYRHRFDLMHFPHFNVPLCYWKRFVVTIHDLILVHYPTVRNTTRFAFFYWVKFVMYRMVIASAIHRARHIITVSHFTERDILKHYPHARGKTTVTYEAADQFCHVLSLDRERVLLASLGLLHEGQEKKGSASHDIISQETSTPLFKVRPYFLYVGNAYPHKNLAILFSLARAFPDHVLVLVGKEDFFYARLKDEAVRVGVRNIVFTGFLSDRELSALYRFARVYVFPSLYEGFGLPPLEAMTYGTPVVASDRGSLPEILGEAASFFDPAVPETLVTQVRKVEEDETVRLMLRERGYQQVKKFHFRTMADLTMKIYQSILQNKQQCHDIPSLVQKL